MERLENVATPLTADTLGLPDSTPPPGLVRMETVTMEVELVTVLLKASCTVTRTEGVTEAPAVVFVGCTVKASLVAAAGGMLNADEVAEVSDAEDAASV